MILDFLRSFRSQWLTLMTGALTIPLTILAFYLDATWQRVAFACFALLCATIAAYRAWASEHAEVVRLQALIGSRRPRIVLGYEQDRGYDAFANDPSYKHEPFFLRNDGDDTALNLRIADSAVGNRSVTFFLTANHLIAGGAVGLHMYSDRDRIDRSIERLFISLLDETLRAGATKAIELRLRVRIQYSDRHHQYETMFHITSGARPRPAGGFQMDIVRVELQE